MWTKFPWLSFVLACIMGELVNCLVPVARSTQTCAEPSLAQTLFQAYNPGTIVHVLNFRHAFESANTKFGGTAWNDQQPAFRAWPTQQPFTVPLFQLATPDHLQYVFRIGTDALTPPVVNGFNTDIGVIGWVYSTQVCGSVPLMSVVLESESDRFFTTNAFEHDSFVNADGWVDDGVVAFVLPL